MLLLGQDTPREIDLQPSLCTLLMETVNMLPKGAPCPQHAAVGTGWALLAAG